MKKINRILTYIVTAAAIVLFCMVLVRAVSYSSSGDLTIPSNNDALITNKDYPVRLRIPRLAIDAKVQKVGITGSGKMAVPTNYSDTGWYKYGTVPGQRGAAVIAGHVDDGLALPGVFKRLDELRAGDDIYVTMDDGTTLHFVMRGSKSYSKDVETDEIFIENSSKLLRLITCTGSWLPDQRTHDQRLVMTAVLK